MSFQFGTNWPGFMETVGNVAGPLLAYEVLTAFFLEATFLGIMLFGAAARVEARAHAGHRAGGSRHLSVGILDPRAEFLDADAGGFEMIDGRVHATDWLAILFNPSMPYRADAHAAGLGPHRGLPGRGPVGLALAARRPRARRARATLRTGVVIAALLIPLQIFVGDLHGLNTLEHQPAKIAAMEAVWQTETRRAAAAVRLARRGRRRRIVSRSGSPSSPA